MYQLIKIKFSKIYTRLMLLTCYTMSGSHLPLLFKFQTYPTNHKHHHFTYPATPAPPEVNPVITQISSQSRAPLIFFCLKSCRWNY